MDEKVLNKFFDDAAWLSSSSTDELIQNTNNNKNGILRYNELTPTIDDLKFYLALLSPDGLELLSQNRLKTLINYLNPIFENIRKIQSTDKDPNRTDAQQKTPTLNFFNDVNSQYQRIIPEIRSIILESVILRNKYTQNTSELNNKVKQLNDLIKTANIDKDKLDSILASAQTELSKGGVEKHSEIFTIQAKKHEENSNTWKKYVIGLLSGNLIAIITVLILIIYCIEEQTIRIEVGIFASFLISMISYASVLSVKNYFAEKHNQAINQHKANCLGTYNTFIDSADDDIRQAVLLYATQTIFSHQKSGFLSKDSVSNNPNPIVELARSISSKSS